MARSRVKLKPGAVPKLLKSPGVRAELLRRARRIAQAAGPGHVAEASVGRTRARATVHTDTIEAMISEATDRTLTRAVDAGRR